MSQECMNSNQIKSNQIILHVRIVIEIAHMYIAAIDNAIYQICLSSFCNAFCSFFLIFCRHDAKNNSSLNDFLRVPMVTTDHRTSTQIEKT